MRTVLFKAAVSEIISSICKTCKINTFTKIYNSIRDLKIEVFSGHFPRTANVKKSRDQGLAVRFAV